MQLAMIGLVVIAAIIYILIFRIPITFFFGIIHYFTKDKKYWPVTLVLWVMVNMLLFLWIAHNNIIYLFDIVGLH